MSPTPRCRTVSAAIATVFIALIVPHVKAFPLDPIEIDGTAPAPTGDELAAINLYKEIPAKITELTATINELTMFEAEVDKWLKDSAFDAKIADWKKRATKAEVTEICDKMVKMKNDVKSKIQTLKSSYPMLKSEYSFLLANLAKTTNNEASFKRLNLMKASLDVEYKSCKSTYEALKKTFANMEAANK